MIITLTPQIEPIVSHISNLQQELKKLEAELKQYKTLLQNDYMVGVQKIETVQGLTVASIIDSKSSSLDKAKFSIEMPQAFQVYEGYIVEKTYSYLKVK